MPVPLQSPQDMNRRHTKTPWEAVDTNSTSTAEKANMAMCDINEL